LAHHQPGIGQRRLHRRLGGLGQTQQQEGDQGDGDLDADGIFAAPEEMADFQGLLDPAEEQRPAPAQVLCPASLARSSAGA
jgi:hypothetical protein